MSSERAVVRYLGRRDYSEVWTEMRSFTDSRDAGTTDEFWVVEHPPVYTQGQAGKPEHLLNAHGIPVVQTDRGGQITYHGPGQIVIYTLCNLRRTGKGVRAFVSAIEDAIIALLADYGVASANRPDAPGVYVGDSKIAALGLRVRQGSSYHGLSLNVDMDLSPFAGINPCGYAGLSVTSTREQGIAASMESLSHALIAKLHDSIYTQTGPAVDTPAHG